MTDVSNKVLKHAAKIKLLLLDVDGVLSDGKIYFSSDKQELKSFHTLDGHGIKMLKKSGVEVGIITGRSSDIVAKRAADLGITLLIQGREDKWEALQEMLAEFPCELEKIAYVGDDYPDLLVMTRIGLAVTVAGAIDAMVKHSLYQTKRAGGEGAVREVCDLIMRAQGSYDAALKLYTRQ